MGCFYSRLKVCSVVDYNAKSRFCRVQRNIVGQRLRTHLIVVFDHKFQFETLTHDISTYICIRKTSGKPCPEYGNPAGYAQNFPYKVVSVSGHFVKAHFDRQPQKINANATCRSGNLTFRLSCLDSSRLPRHALLIAAPSRCVRVVHLCRRCGNQRVASVALAEPKAVRCCLAQYARRA